MNRREFLYLSASALMGICGISPVCADNFSEKAVYQAGLSLHEALFYTRFGDKVRCDLCPNFCVLTPGTRGLCGVRANFKGKLFSLVYGKVVATAIDPVEKKPMYHFLPGSRAYSIATAGCCLKCVFCQNWHISQSLPENSLFETKTAEEIVNEARLNKCESIAYTYTEPVIFYEFMLDCAKKAQTAGMYNILVSCGYVNPEPAQELLEYIDGSNIDLKGFSERFYDKFCNGSLQPVLNTLKLHIQKNVICEITNLIIPGANDDDVMLNQISQYVSENLGNEIPLHFSRFFPHYKLTTVEKTPEKTMEKAFHTAQKNGLKHVYTGNIAGGHSNTACPACGKTVVERMGFYMRNNALKNGVCSCGRRIYGKYI